MSIRKILIYPTEEAALRKKSIPVSNVDQSIKSLINDLKDRLAAHPDRIGLAAPQINVHQRVVVGRLCASH